MKDLQILCPTELEYLPVRALLRAQRVERCGVGLSLWHPPELGGSVIVCGLAGALDSTLLSGSIVIPTEAVLPGGRVVSCDGELVSMLLAGARSLGFMPSTGRVLTAAEIVTGEARAQWSRQGFSAVDMESGLLDPESWRVASLRVILDTPARSISPDWLRPARAVRRPECWPELLWLAIAAPRFAWRAARVLRAALRYPPVPGARGGEETSRR